MTKTHHPTLSGLYLITDPKTCPSQTILLHKAHAALKGGVRLIQYRSKLLSKAQQLQDCLKLKQICGKYNAHLLINDHLEIAQKLNLGLHIGQQDISLTTARTTLGHNTIIGVTCHDQLSLALAAEKAGADYVSFGAFFNSHTKTQAHQASPNILIQAKHILSLPLCAIGGINIDTAGLLYQKGADLIAISHAILSSTNIEATCTKLKFLCNQKKSHGINGFYDRTFKSMCIYYTPCK